MSIIKNNVSLYSRWINIIHRCTNPRFHSYRIYGGRGITICEEWLVSFECFCKWASENGYKKELQIDRIDNNLGYSPDNCRWISGKENTINRRVTVTLTYKGETKSVAEWADIFGISYDTLFRRVADTKWTAEQIIETKKGARKFGRKPMNRSIK